MRNRTLTLRNRIPERQEMIMKTFLTIFSFCLMNIVSFSHATEPGDKFPSSGAITPYTHGYELVILSINHGLDGKVKYVEAKGCQGCNGKRFTINQSTQLLTGNSILPVSDISLFNNRSADITYHPETLMLRTINVHIVEER